MGNRRNGICRHPIIKRCAAWLCENKVITYKRGGNTSGHAEYCCRGCYEACSPAKRRVADILELFPLPSTVNPYSEFVGRISSKVLQEGYSRTTKELNVSRNTLLKWLGRLNLPSNR